MNRNQQENKDAERNKRNKPPQPEASRERHRERLAESAKHPREQRPDTERTEPEREELAHPPAQESDSGSRQHDVRPDRP